MLPQVPQRVAQNTIFNKIQFQSVTKFRYVTNSSRKVVEQSISYEITEKCRTESVSFHLKYWLKLTYPVVASAAQAVIRCRMT